MDDWSSDDTTPRAHWPITIDEARGALKEERFTKATSILEELITREPANDEARSLLVEVEEKAHQARIAGWQGGGASRLFEGPSGPFVLWCGIAVLLLIPGGTTAACVLPDAFSHRFHLTASYDQIVYGNQEVNLPIWYGLLAMTIEMTLAGFAIYKAFRSRQT